MYGKSDVPLPRRIVCLTAEHVEICYALGAGDRVVGVPGTVQRPAEAREKTKVGGFTSFRVDRILGLEPDLVLAFSDLQAEVSAELIRSGVDGPLHQSAIGGRDPPDHLDRGRRPRPRRAGPRPGAGHPGRDQASAGSTPACGRLRPRVYFEEWPDPLIAGIRWVSEIVEIAGGRDIFPELRDRRVAAGADRGRAGGRPA